MFSSRERLTLHPQRDTDPTTNPDLSVRGKYGAPLERPLWRIQIYPGVIAYEDMDPLIAADGAPIAATGPGTWGQLYRAGRP
jgi:hypothetical protein